MIVGTRQGKVRGAVSDGVARFLDVPYAAAPFGSARFAPPGPHQPWEGIRDADDFGPTSPQVPYPGGLGTVLPTRIIPGEEILNLNIWAPGGPVPGSGHPVMVWVHGGGLTHGCSALETYDGHAFARDGVVLVSVNYRLGAEGFSVLDDAPVNLGLADQMAALRWVQDNIRAFGGDPARVTVFGQSAGATSVAALLAGPDASSVISQAIVQSGPLAAVPRERARRATELLAKDLGIPPTRAAFSAVPPADLLAGQERVLGRSSLVGGPAFGIVAGDELVPVDPAVALESGSASSIPLMLGYTTEEYRLWFLPSGTLDRITPLHLFGARLKFRAPRRAIGLYRRNRSGARTGEILGALATDVLLRVPKNRLADARNGRTWMYEFSWRSPVVDLGAAHALELGFVFDTLSSAEAEAFAGPDRPQQLADAMHAAWVRFAATGDPGWPAWDERRPVMTFDHPDSGVVLAPRDDERRAVARQADKRPAGRTATTEYAATSDGRRLVHHRRGTGSPVVFLEAGSGASSSSWVLVVDQLAAATTVVTYDRSGLGASLPDPAPRVLSRMVDDFSDLVAAVAPGEPCVIVGHSLGGPIARLFAYRHPDQVAGLVLVDPTSEEYAAFFNGAVGRLFSAAYLLGGLLARTGLLEWLIRRRVLFPDLERTFEGMPAQQRDDLRRELCSPATLRTARREYASVPDSLRELAEAATRSPVPEVPVTVLTGGRISKGDRRQRPKMTAIHARYVATLPQGRHVVSALAGHLIPQDDPQLVVDETLRIVDQIQNR